MSNIIRVVQPDYETEKLLFCLNQNYCNHRNNEQFFFCFKNSSYFGL